MKQGLTAESKMFGFLVLLVGAIVVAGVAWDIYLHPPDPDPVGTARIVVSGTEGIAFRGTVGTVRDEHEIEGRTPLKFSVPYRRADYVAASVESVEEDGSGTLQVAIEQVREQAKDKIVQREQTGAGREVVVVWKPPRSGR